MTSLTQSACCVSFFQLSTKTIYSIPASSLLPGKSVTARVSGATSWRAMVTPSPSSNVSNKFDCNVIDSPPESSSECTSLGVSYFPSFQEFQRNCTNCTLQSFLSLVLAVAMASGIQGAPSSRDTFENVPQTLSGTNFFLFLSLSWCCNEMHPVSFIGLMYSRGKFAYMYCLQHSPAW